MKLKYLLSMVYRKYIGEYKYAMKNGLISGTGVTVMGGVYFGSEPYLITLGDRVRISGDVRFITHDGGTWAFRREADKEKIVRFGKIKIGDDTFIGMRSIIMPGVTIGKNCVVGAGSIVTKDVPDRCVVAGMPAKVICTTDEYAQKCKDKMPENFDFAEYYKDKQGYLTKVL